MLKYLGEPNGRTVLDIAGGTGNYAQVLSARGFRAFIIDREVAMLARSGAKIGAGRQIVGDALALPVRGRGVDATICVSALHQFADQRVALAEARRVIREGPFVLQVFTKENLSPLFVFEYFPGSAPPPGMHQTADEIESMLRGVGFGNVQTETFVYADTADGSLAALHTDPFALAGSAYLRNTSWWHGLDDGTRKTGLMRLAEDLRSGRLEERVKESFRLAARHGHGTVFAASP